MASFTNSTYQFLCAVLVLLHTRVLCFQYKVGDLDAWGIPTSVNSHVYTNWAQKHHFQIGDSLLFLYPPSQDSVIQVTEQAFNNCNISEPIRYLQDGNSVFNLTSPQKYYFTSGVPGHCEKSQKLGISLISGDGSSFSPSYAPSMLPATSPSYANAFGSIPTSSSPTLQGLFGSVIVAVGSAIMFILYCI
ncbi:hypothetical protein MRB53_019699 [Persea americana]|uniref:Uncharacterized protein n=1 Tax=Persea americana TaxID=3435 RepID=A0ACC2KZ77_PERAE|nr:hypothetical protein MRB53_019699 [Persea americana]|eukprot:TRINITY_DN6446_c0_g1_i2.p1 TRINITY_DN6446_c0_g1~~TRINITY_DN6446_c0_g1_i2.p1  ORF type:complete len:190 (+),score=29.25 TRINITY_DN6446_c0_g1_i2:430-999(+)